MIKNINYELSATFTREHITALGKVSEFVGNIESMIKTDFQSSAKTIDWEQFRKVMTIFNALYKEDTIAVIALSKTVNDVNSGKITILAGRIYDKEKK